MSILGFLFVMAILGSAFFSGSETAVVSSNRMRQRAAREDGRAGAGFAERLYLHPERTLAVMLLGTNVFNVLASVTAVLITDGLLQGGGIELPAFAVDSIATLWVAPLVLVLGEVLPKGFGYLYADRFTRVASPLLLPLGWILWPILYLLESFSRWLGRIFSGGSLGADRSMSWEMVRLHVQTGREEGAVAHEEEVLIGRIAQLNRLSAQSLMRPLSELTLFPFDGNVGDLLAHQDGNPSPRIFLFRAGDQGLEGVIAGIKLLGQPASRPLSELARPLRSVPASRPLLDLIDELQFTHSKFASVTDLRGRVMGVVFLRDLLGRLVRLRESDDIGQ